MATNPQIELTAVDKTRAAFASVNRHFDDLSGKVGAFTGKLGLIGGAVGTAIAALQGIQIVNVLDQLDDLQEKTGISVESLSVLRYAGETNSVAFESLAKGVGRLSKLMAEAAGGNKEANATFDALGISVTDANGKLKGSDTVLGELADRFASYEDGAGKAALAQKIFGKSGAELLPILNLGSAGIRRLAEEAKALGAVYSADLAKAAADFNDNLVKIKFASEAAAISIADPLIKTLAQLSSQYVDARIKGEGFLGFLTRSTTVLPDVANALKALPGARIFGLIQEAGDVANQRAANDARELARFNRAAEAGRPAKVAAPIVQDPGSKGSSKDPLAEAKRYLESLQKQAEKLQDISTEEEALLSIQKGRIGIVSPALEKEILQTARLIDLKKAEKDSLEASTKAAKEAADAAGKLAEQAAQFAQEVETPYEKLQRSLEDIQRAADSNPLISAETAARMGTKAWQEYLKSLEDANKELNKFDDFAKHAAENIQDALGNGVYDILSGNFKNIGDSFKQMLNRMVAEAVAADLSRKLFGNLVQGGSGSGLLGGALSAVAGMFGGGFDMYGGATGVQNSAIMSGVNAGQFGGASDGVTDALFRKLPKFDVGTDFVPQDMVAVVHKGEKIVPAAQNKPGYGGSTIQQNIHFYNNGPMDRTSQANMAAVVLQAGRRGQRVS